MFDYIALFFIVTAPHGTSIFEAREHHRGRRTAKALSMDVETVPIVSGVGTSPPNRSPCNTFRLVERANRFPSTPIERCKATPSALRGEAQMVSPASRTERVSCDHSHVFGAWICLLLQSAQPRLASANIEYVILALP